MVESLLEIRGLTIEFAVNKIWFPAVREVDLRLETGEILAVVGESGSGKSTLAMAIPGLLAPNARLHGSIRLAGDELAGADEATLTKVRGDRVGVVFQEPMTAFNPVYTIGWQISEAIRMHRDMTKEQTRARVVELLELVDMPDPATRIDYYPHQLSGGQRQRAMIAQALACDPALLIADEPTTALDVTVQGEILDLIRDLRTRVDAAILLITHDMGVVADLADRIMVMKDGEVVESGSAQTLFSNPTHPYTRALLNAVPHLGTGRLQVSEFEPEPEPLLEPPRAGAEPRPGDRRRTDLGTGRLGAGPGAHTAARPAGRPWLRVPVHQPRSGRHRGTLRPHRGDAVRPAGGVRSRRDGAQSPDRELHRQADRLGAGA